VATPLRLLSVVRAQAVDLSAVQVVVLDEADKLFDLEAGRGNKAQEEDEDEEDKTPTQSAGKNAGKRSGDNDSSDAESSDGEAEDETTAKRIRTSFLSQVDEILAECPDKGVQRALYSATVGPFVRELAESFLQNPVQITIGKENAGASTIDQKLMFVGREDGKLLAIRQIVQAGLRPPVLLFMQTSDRAKVGVLVCDSSVTQGTCSAFNRGQFRSHCCWHTVCCTCPIFQRVNCLISFGNTVRHHILLVLLSYIRSCTKS
jgi:ATP-dependent RNA helicase DDX52/ROK1